MDKSYSTDEYWRLVDLWRFYMNLMVQATTLYAAISGGILSFVFTNPGNSELVKYSLLVPAMLGLGFGTICFFGCFQSRELSESLKSLAKDVGIYQPVHSTLLPWVVGLASGFYLTTALGCLFVVFQLNIDECSGLNLIRR